MDARNALVDGFSQWLEQLCPRENSRIRQGSRLDPFATSMRVTKQAVRPLIAVAEGSPVPGDSAQAITDLRSAGLVETVTGISQPTDLGRAVLADWRTLGLANDDDKLDLARSGAMVRRGIELGQSDYESMLFFWQKLRELRPADDWLADPYNLYTVSYLNWTDDHGYNPYRVLVALGHDFVGLYEELRMWAATMDKPAGWSVSPLDRVLAAITSLATRAAGRISFCRAMEAFHLARTEPAALPETLIRWGI